MEAQVLLAKLRYILRFKTMKISYTELYSLACKILWEAQVLLAKLSTVQLSKLYQGFFCLYQIQPFEILPLSRNFFAFNFLI